MQERSKEPDPIEAASRDSAETGSFASKPCGNDFEVQLNCKRNLKAR